MTALPYPRIPLPVYPTRPGEAARTSVPGGARMSIPACGPPDRFPKPEETVPATGGTKPDPVEPVLRDAIPRGGPAPGNQHGDEEGADPAAGDQRSNPWIPTRGTKRHPPRIAVSVRSPTRVTRVSSCSYRPPTGRTMMPPSRQLGDPGCGDGRRRRGGEDAVERRVPGRPERTVSDDERHVPDPHRREEPPGAGGKGREALDRHQFSAEAREDRRLVPRTGPDLENLLRAGKPERGRHLGDDVRLGDRLPLPDGERLVRVGEVPHLLRNEEVPRHLFHYRQHALVANSPTADLFLHHAAAEDGFLHQVHFRKARRAV